MDEDRSIHGGVFFTPPAEAQLQVLAHVSGVAWKGPQGMCCPHDSRLLSIR